MKVENAEIESVKLGFDRGTFLTLWVFLKFKTGGQGFGGFVFANTYKMSKGGERPNGFGIDYICKLLKLCDVESLEDCKGRPVRVHRDDTKVSGIGHLFRDEWLYPEELADQYREEVNAQ